MRSFLLINARSGKASPTAEELRDEALDRGIAAHLFRPGDDAQALARAADADALGVAGGDGSLAAIAAVALERDLPFVCVPFGTRNHFARDVGLDRANPVAALDSFRGVERRIDIGRVNEHVFLNNVSVGMYARLVDQRERHRRRRETLARLRAILIALRQRSQRGVTVDGDPVTYRVLLVSNNRYDLDLLSLGERTRLDEGCLYLYIGTGVVRSRWTERAARELRVNATTEFVQAAIDGEPVRLEMPLEFRVEPQALRVLLPPDV